MAKLLVRGELIVFLIIGFLASQAICEGHLSKVLSRFRLKKEEQGSAASKTELLHDPSPQDVPQEEGPPPIRLAKAKSNKVSKLLHFIHDRATDAVYGSHVGKQNASNSSPNETKVVKMATPLEARADEPNEIVSTASDLPDEQVIESTCDDIEKKTICKHAVKQALKKSPEQRAKIAAALRHRPADVLPSKVLYHSLLGNAVESVESKGIDEALDTVINLAATKNPYGFVVVNAIDMAIKD